MGDEPRSGTRPEAAPESGLVVITDTEEAAELTSVLLDELGQTYAGSPAVRGAIGLVTAAFPLAAVVDNVLVAKAQRRDQERLHAFLRRLVGAIFELDANHKVLAARVESDEMRDLLEVGAAMSARTPSASKIELFADILAGSVSIDAPDDLDVEALLRSIDGLSPREISQARGLYDDVKNPKQLYFRRNPWRPSWGADTEYYLKRLEGVGLIFEDRPIVGQVGGGGGPGDLRITPTFERLIQLLRLVGRG